FDTRGSSSWDSATHSQNRNSSTCQVHKLTVGNSTVSLEEMAGSCCLGGRKEMVSGSLNTCLACGLESWRSLFLGAAGNKSSRDRTSRKAAYALASLST